MATPRNTAFSKATRQYGIRFSITMGSYVILLFAGIFLAQLAGSSPWRFAAMALPVPALIGVVWAMLNYLRAADELQTKSIVEALAVGFAGGSVTTFTYGLMQFVGAPPANWTFVWAVYALWWVVGGVLVRRRYR
jgi:F0F1-type ATP synthase assembly protein I